MPKVYDSLDPCIAVGSVTFDSLGMTSCLLGDGLNGGGDSHFVA